MNIDTFMSQVETYYGKYENEKLKSFVRAYLLKDYKEEKFDEILKAILYYHKANFGSPCIATIEECIKSARLEKGQVDPHKLKTTNTTQYQDYKKEKLEITDEEKQENIVDFRKDLKEIFKGKKV